MGTSKELNEMGKVQKLFALTARLESVSAEEGFSRNDVTCPLSFTSRIPKRCVS